MVSFAEVSPPESCMHLFSRPYVPHAPPISSFLITRITFGEDYWSWIIFEDYWSLIIFGGLLIMNNIWWRLLIMNNIWWRVLIMNNIWWRVLIMNNIWWKVLIMNNIWWIVLIMMVVIMQFPPVPWQLIHLRQTKKYYENPHLWEPV